ncbi:MAG TPA: mannose-6-phosphate isomerase [Candidatus Aminicenantes bacterium]|nr:mannose-6-phosphate isomerase [Candidatus Aminicenantes bacterium]
MKTRAPEQTGVRFNKKIVEEVRPWGKFRSYPHHAAGSLKIITVSPGRALSLQYHRRRSEFWVVLDTGLEMTLGERVWQPKKGEEIFIPRRTPHRLRCVGRRPGRVMELWIGRSSEQDIIRLQDDFGRLT